MPGVIKVDCIWTTFVKTPHPSLRNKKTISCGGKVAWWLVLIKPAGFELWPGYIELWSWARHLTLPVPLHPGAHIVYGTSKFNAEPQNKPIIMLWWTSIPSSWLGGRNTSHCFMPLKLEVRASLTGHLAYTCMHTFFYFRQLNLWWYGELWPYLEVDLNPSGRTKTN